MQQPRKAERKKDEESINACNTHRTRRFASTASTVQYYRSNGSTWISFSSRGSLAFAWVGFCGRRGFGYSCRPERRKSREKKGVQRPNERQKSFTCVEDRCLESFESREEKKKDAVLDGENGFRGPDQILFLCCGDGEMREKMERCVESTDAWGRVSVRARETRRWKEGRRLRQNGKGCSQSTGMGEERWPFGSRAGLCSAA